MNYGQNINNQVVGEIESERERMKERGREGTKYKIHHCRIKTNKSGAVSKNTVGHL